jgi:membrane protein YdbS with pleckstrin-like domain
MQQNYGTIHIRPSMKQFVINELPMLAMCVALLCGMPVADFGIRPILFLVLLFALCALVTRLLSFRRISFTITGQQIVSEHGLLNHSSDYIELYRVVDFRESRTPMQQLCGLKTVSIYSGDRTTPKLDIFGIRNDINLVSYIRTRVEVNKRMKGVYEITNR